MSWLKLATVAAALTAGIAWGVWPAPKVVERTLDLPAGQTLDGSGGPHVVRISRDAANLAYVASLLYIWPLTRQNPEATPVPGTLGFNGASATSNSRPTGR